MSRYFSFLYFEAVGPLPLKLSPDISSISKLGKFPKISSKLLIGLSYIYGKKACSTFGHP